MSDTVVKRKPLKSISGYPYRPARLVPQSMDITRPWYIVFYAWDIGTDRLERKRVLHDEFAALSDLESRTQMAEGIIDEINYFLKNDWHLHSSPAPKILDVNFKGYSLIDGLKYSLKYLLEVKGTSKDTVKKYSEVVDTVREFLTASKLPTDYKLVNLNNAFAQAYFEYIKTQRGNANNTYNYKKGALTTLSNVILDKDPRMFGGINPFSKIKKLKAQTRKHAAFTDEQLKSILNHVKAKGQTQIILFIQFMYYTLARGKELAGLRVGNIHFDRRQILFKADESKTGIEQYVGINDRFAQIILESGILNFPPEYYVFSNDDGFHQPGKNRVGKNYFYNRVSEAIDDMGYYAINPNFTPYGIKHTGAIALYLATRNIHIVMHQCRHTILETTITYLKDLGVFVDFNEELNKMKGAI